MARKPFVVIDAEILSSSVWAESAPTKLVWITMLILCDTEGYVGAAVPGIARAAGVTLQEATDAIERLQQPDPYSRTKANEGRRIEEAERGWRILNFKEHLSRLSTERQKSRERMRKWRANGWQRRRSEIPFPSVGARCACCNKEFETPLSRFCVLDHDHETGIGRAYVCKSCNRRIADAESGHNAPDHVWEYLKRHGVSQVTAGASRVTAGKREKGIGNREQTEERIPAPSAPATLAASWSKQACDDWIDRYGGTAPGGQIGKAIKPLVDRHGWSEVRQAWRSYLAQTEAEYASASRFAATYGRWSGGAPVRSAVEDKTRAGLEAWVAAKEGGR